MSRSEPPEESIDGSPAFGAVRVLDLSAELGAYATRLLARLGADVLKLEQPGGDRQRRLPPFAADKTGSGSSLLFSYYHHGKRGLTLDTGRPEAEPILRRLASTCDVIVFEPQARRPVVGLDRELGTASWVDEEQILAFLTPFGRGGPWQDLRVTPLVSYAMSGLMWRLGPAEGPPMAPPGRQMYDQLGAHAAAAIMVALLERPVVGGQVVDLSLHELQSSQDDQIDRFDLTGTFAGRSSAVPTAPPTGIWECADGVVELMVYNPAHWDGFVRVLGSPEDLQDEALRQRPARFAQEERLAIRVAEELRNLKMNEIVERCQAEGVPCAQQYTPGEFVDDIQLSERGYWVDLPLPGSGSGRFPGDPFLSNPPLLTETRPAPLLGEHDDEVYVHDLGFDRAEIDMWRESGLVAPR